MFTIVEKLIAAIWNRLCGRRDGAWQEKGGTELGLRVIDGQVTRQRVSISNVRRTMHLAVLGKTGSGKSSLLRYLAAQDIEAGRGFAAFDIHGDMTPFLLGTINARERRERRHLSDKLVLIEPADPAVSIGLNPLEQETADFVRTAEVGEVLRWRWGLDHFGARTDELLRNSLYVLSSNGLTLIELAPLLNNPTFRATCLRRVDNAEVRQYFESRYGQASEAMRATMREPILNKTSAFTADPHFRHIVGQAKSTFSLRTAMDEGQWVIVNLEKGRLGAQALTLGSLIFTALKNALFTREKRSLFTLYCDEIQNLVSYGGGIETVLSEARKFGCSIVGAHQFLEQLPTELRSAMSSVGTHVSFQLASQDATQMAQALDGGKSLAERLKNLPQRHAIVKSGPDRWTEIAVPTVRNPKVDYTDLVNRTRYTRGRARAQVEREIAKRLAGFTGNPDEGIPAYE